jgi:ArsR family transcriptional regulator
VPDAETLPVVADAEACCAPLSAGPISMQQAEQLSARLKALSDPVRLRLMSLIASSTDEACFCDLNNLFDQSQPTISHHLKVLYDAGLIDREKRGVWVYYRPRPDMLASLATLFGPARPRQRRARP